jgi:hypothetical protein
VVLDPNADRVIPLAPAAEYLVPGVPLTCPACGSSALRAQPRASEGGLALSVCGDCGARIWGVAPGPAPGALEPDPPTDR